MPDEPADDPDWMAKVKFEAAKDYMSFEWEAAYPDHCFKCHLLNADDADDTSQCGEHCKVKTDA